MFLLVIGVLVSGWFFWFSEYAVSHRFNSLLLSINKEPRRILSKERITLHPNDKLKILNISTNIPFNIGVRLVARDIDINALRYEEIRLSSLLPGQNIFDHYQWRIWVKYRNEDLGHVDWEVKPYAEDWLDKADRIINAEKRVAFLELGQRMLPQNKPMTRRLIDEYKSLGRWGQAASMLEQTAGKIPDRNLLLELLQVYAAKADRGGIVSVLRRLIKLDPEDLESRTQLAEILEQSGKMEAAAKEYQALLERVQERERLPVYERLGYLYTEMGKLKDAVSYYLMAVKLDQKDANLHYNLAYLYEKLNQKEKARFYLQNAVTLNQGDLENRLKLAQTLLESGQPKKAAKHLQQVLAKRPDSLEALLMMAQVMEKSGRKDRLKEIYEKILSLDQNNETIVYNLGVLEYEAGNLKSCRPYFERYVKSHPKDIWVHEVLFDIYKRQQDTPMAVKQARTLVDLKPKEAGPYHYLFEYLNGKGEDAQIIVLMKKGLEANPREVQFRKYLVVAYLKTGKEGLAIDQMKAILQTHPGDLDLLLQLARLQEKCGKLAGAANTYKRIIEILPGHEEAEDAYLRLRLEGVLGDDKE